MRIEARTCTGNSALLCFASDFLWCLVLSQYQCVTDGQTNTPLMPMSHSSIGYSNYLYHIGQI